MSAMSDVALGVVQEQRDQLVTIIDFCNEMAWSNWTFAKQAIFDAHDVAHVLLGGDRMRDTWRFMGEATTLPDHYGTKSFPDVKRRIQAIIAEQESQP